MEHDRLNYILLQVVEQVIYLKYQALETCAQWKFIDKQTKDSSGFLCVVVISVTVNTVLNITGEIYSTTWTGKVFVVIHRIRLWRRYGELSVYRSDCGSC